MNEEFREGRPVGHYGGINVRNFWIGKFTNKKNCFKSKTCNLTMNFLVIFMGAFVRIFDWKLQVVLQVVENNVCLIPI